MQQYFWGKPAQLYPHLQKNSHTTVAILGAGIAGLSAGLMLQDAGIRDVTIIEKYLVGSGSTGSSAGMRSVNRNKHPGLMLFNHWDLLKPLRI